jgi:hypothetical protein
LKKLILLLVIGLIFIAVIANEEEDGSARTNISLRFGIGLLRPTHITAGITHSSFSTTSIDHVNFRPANGFQIGFSSVMCPLISDRARDGEVQRTFVINEIEMRYVQRNYQTNILYEELTNHITSGWLDYNHRFKHDVMGREIFTPFIGIGLSWMLHSDSDFTRTSRFVDDVSILAGFNLWGFRYEYKHGLRQNYFAFDHRTRINTHSFSFSVGF